METTFMIVQTLTMSAKSMETTLTIAKIIIHSDNITLKFSLLTYSLKFSKRMHIFRCLIPSLVILILSSSLSNKMILKTTASGQNLSTNVCKITKDIIKSKTDAQDILIGNLGGKLWTTTLNDIAGCIGSDNSVIVNDFEEALTEKSLRKAAVIILALGWADQVCKKANFKYQ